MLPLLSLPIEGGRRWEKGFNSSSVSRLRYVVNGFGGGGEWPDLTVGMLVAGGGGGGGKGGAVLGTVAWAVTWGVFIMGVLVWRTPAPRWGTSGGLGLEGEICVRNHDTHILRNQQAYREGYLWRLNKPSELLLPTKI